jgi:hypothetical protein
VNKAGRVGGGVCSPAVDGIGGGGNSASCTAVVAPNPQAAAFLRVQIP